MEEIIRDASDLFNITVTGYNKIKASYILETKCGVFLLRKQTADIEKIKTAKHVTDSFYNSGFSGCERFLTAKDGSPFIRRRDEIFTASECGGGIKSCLSDIGCALSIASALGKMGSANIYVKPDDFRISNNVLPSYYAVRLSEARHIKKWIGKQSRYSDVDTLFIKKYDEYISKAESLITIMERYMDKKMLTVFPSAIKDDEIFVNENMDVTFTNLVEGEFSLGVIVLCTLIKKHIKRGGGTESINHIINAYSKYQALGYEDLELINAYLLFPHKFFAIINKYYNSRRIFSQSNTYTRLRNTISNETQLSEALYVKTLKEAHLI